MLPVNIEERGGKPHVTMTQNAPEFGPRPDPAPVAAVGGLAPEDILGAPQVVSTGLPFCITVLRSAEALARVRLDVAALEKLRASAGGALADVMEPFWVVLEGATEAGDSFARLLLAPPMPPEDPFTGSATGAMGAYLWAEGLIDRPDFVAEQGHGMGRPGRAEVQVLGPRGAITGVRVGGMGHVLMRGTIDL